MKNTIKENREFRYCYKKGKKIVSSYVVLHYTKNRTEQNKLGITVAKLRTAVERNRAKRLIRECYRAHFNEIQGGYNVVIVARSKMSDATLDDVNKAMKYCIRKSDLI